MANGITRMMDAEFVRKNKSKGKEYLNALVNKFSPSNIAKQNIETQPIDLKK